MSENQRLTKKEAAELLRISVRQVQRLMASGKLAYEMGYTPRGDVALFDRQELERFAEAREQQVYVPAHPRRPDISSHRGASHGVSLALNSDMARSGLEAVQVSAREISRQMAEALDGSFRQLAEQIVPAMAAVEAMQKVGAELAEHLRSAAKLELPLVELAEKTWLNRREAIRLSGLPAKTVNEGLKNRRLGAKTGGRWIIRRTDLDRFAAAWKPRNGRRRKN